MRVTINPIYVRGGQSARDDKSHIRSTRLQQEGCAEVTAPLVDLINARAGEYPKSVQQEQRQVKSAIR